MQNSVRVVSLSAILAILNRTCPGVCFLLPSCEKCLIVRVFLVLSFGDSEFWGVRGTVGHYQRKLNLLGYRELR